MGFELETLEISVDFPALGKPTKPTSARTFNSSDRDKSSPKAPSFAILGATLFLVLNLALPKPPLPPFAIIKLSLFSSETYSMIAEFPI